MILTSDVIRQGIKENVLISRPPYISCPDWEERCQFIEGCSFDLTVGRLFQPDLTDTSCFISELERKLPAQTEIPPYHQVRAGVYGWSLEASQGYYVAQTGEAVNLPQNVMGLLFPRASLFRPGIIPHVTTIKPGYSGALTFGLSVHSNFSISLGARLITLVMVMINVSDNVEVDAYSGIWSGNKVTTQGVERAF